MLEAVQRYRAIENATSSTDDTPPVYVMDELADMANQSPDQADAIAEHVHKRLQNKSPVVKWKALRLVRHMCMKGCPRFQRSMQGYAASIRDLVHFKGEKDAFKGDSLNQRVRDTAKEVVEVLYGTYRQQSASGTGRAKIEGFGSSYGNSGASGSVGFGGPASASFGTGGSNGHSQASYYSSKMVGFGSDGRSMQPQPAGSALPDLTSTVSSAVGNIGGLIRSQFSTGSKEQTSALHQRTGSQDDGNGYADIGSSQARPGTLTLNRGAGGSFGPLPGRAGGASATFAPSPAPAYAASALGGGNSGASRAGIISVLGSEESLVGDICAPGGMRAAPDPDDLRKFVEASSALDGLRIGELLIEKMGSPSNQVVLRALYALEAVLQLGSSQACGEVAVMFQSDPGPVVRALSSSQAAIKERASRCLKMLLGDEYHQQEAPPSPPRQAVPALVQQPQLLDLLEDDHPAANAPLQEKRLQTGDFLGELTVPAGGVSASAKSEDPFGALFLSAAPAASQTQQPSALGPPAPLGLVPPVPAAGAAAASSAPPPLDDFFSSLSVTQPASQNRMYSQQPATAFAAASPASFAPPSGAFNMPVGAGPGGFIPSGGAYAYPGGSAQQSLPGYGGQASDSYGSRINAGGAGGFGPSSTAPSPSWALPAAAGSVRAQQQLKPAKSLSDSNAFDFVKEHLK